MPNPPVAKKIPTSVKHHGHTLHDDYAWLRQDNWQEMFRDTSLLRADIREYLEAENAYTKVNLTDQNHDLINQLVDEMKARTEIFYDSAAYEQDGYAYFYRYSEAEYPSFIRRVLATGHEEIILDVPIELATNGRKVFLGNIIPSYDNRILAVAVDFSGSECHEVWFKDMATGQWLDQKLERVGELIWSSDSQSIYYTKFSDDPNEYRHNRVFKHVLYTQQDQLIFQSDDTRFYLHVTKTSSRRFLKITLATSSFSETRILDLQDATADLICLADQSHKILYDVEHVGDQFYILTNKDAVDFQIMTAPIAAPTIGSWQEFIPHRAGCLVQKIKAFSHYLVRQQLENALPQILVTDLRTSETKTIQFDEAAYDVSIGLCAGFDSPWMRLNYSSPITPLTQYRHNLATQERITDRVEKIPSHDPSHYILERITYPSHDGTMVPMTIVRHKDTKLDGKAPLHLYAYGSYGMIVPSAFGYYNSFYPLLNRGVIYAKPHIRGSTDCGYGWYLDGKLQHKKNTFLDYIAAAKWLVDNNYTSAGRITGEGRSAGGLLMGATANMAPKGLFAGLIADVPFVDVMNTMTDTTLPLTPPEWDEWGNPITDKSAFDYMLSYSPYDNVVAKDYPAMFISGGLTDPRVTYWEPAKWAAKLRAVKTDTNPLYLQIEMDAGHGGDPGRFAHLKERAREYAFLVSVVKK
jgi:oligopeptidase B